MSDPEMHDFYVGYLPRMPVRLSKFTGRTVAGLCLAATVLAICLVVAQAPFEASTFEFLQSRDFTGVLHAKPYPYLAVPATGGVERHLLVAPGKHGATEIAAGWEGRAVRLRGSRIYRAEGRMIELEPGSLKAMAGAAVNTGEAVEDLGLATLSGEIVDSKCFLGVMNPGRGKVHRACAVRCISGGIPPALLAREEQGGTRLYVLKGPDGGLVRREVLDYVAEPVRLTGRVFRSGDLLYLQADLSAIARIKPAE